MPVSRLRYALPLVPIMILLGRFAPSSWFPAVLLGFALAIAALGIWAGVEAWRGVTRPHA